jgi:hypothetical protein
MGDTYDGQIYSDDDDDDNEGLMIDIGRIVLDAADRQRILDDDSIASMKSTAEALMSTPTGWGNSADSPLKDTSMKDADTASTSTPSTLSTQTKEFDVDKLTQDELEIFMTKAAAKLKTKTSQNATPSSEVGEG